MADIFQQVSAILLEYLFRVCPRFTAPVYFSFLLLLIFCCFVTVLEKQPAISLYWKCQLAGWSVAALYWGYTGYIAPGFNLWLAILYFVSDVVLYIGITHLYRTVALRYQWHLLPAGKLVWILLPAVLLLALLSTVLTILKIYYFRRWLSPGFDVSFYNFFIQNRLSVFVAGIRLMSIWLLAYHLYHYARRDIISTKENARLAIINRDIQLNNLSSQLNPHFLFNSLNNIKWLVAENPVAARRAIDLLADLLRTSLNNRDTVLVPLHEEMDMVKDYLELEQFRLEERLQVKININELLLTIPVPRLCIQTLAENAIKHGIEKQKAGGLLYITVESNEHALVIIVRNTGLLQNVLSPTGVGLSNLQERLQLQYKGKAGFSIADNADHTVEAIITIPLT